MEHTRIYDRQRKEYSAYTSIKDLYAFLMGSYCECGEGYDLLDEKDGKLKCENCLKLDNLESVSKDEMLAVLNMYDYEIVDNPINEEEGSEEN